MTLLARERAVAIYSECSGPATALLVDHDEELERQLRAAGAEVGRVVPGYDPDDLWHATAPGSYRLVVLARRASGRQLYRTLSIAWRLVSPGGALLILCPSSAVEDHAYQEATEILVSVEPGVRRTLHMKSNVVELRRSAV